MKMEGRGKEVYERGKMDTKNKGRNLGRERNEIKRKVKRKDKDGKHRQIKNELNK